MSMLTPQVNLQIDMRCRLGKREYTVSYGGIGTTLGGDFLQLPPVRRPTMAKEIDEGGDKDIEDQLGCLCKKRNESYV